MKRTFLLLYLIELLIRQTTFGAVTQISNQPDSVYLFSYATTKNSNTNGLHFAWSTDQQNWTSIGPEMRFLFCDYGRWGVEKRMITPFLFRAPDGMWHCIWSLNEHTGTFAHAESKDLIYWLPQTYPVVMKDNNCLEPEIANQQGGKYTVSWISTSGNQKKAFSVATSDFKIYSPAKEIQLSDRRNLPGRVTNIETALSEALYLTACERNGDVVSMTSYAPLLAKEGHTQWNPDLIYFNNSEVKPTVDYFVQKLYGQNSGDTYLASDVQISDKNDAVRKRLAVSVVHDSKSNDLIVKMVNMLPVAVNTYVRLDGITDFSASATLTVLSGTPIDKKARPVTDQIAVSGEFPCTLPAYSFTLIRINKN